MYKNKINVWIEDKNETFQIDWFTDKSFIAIITLERDEYEPNEEHLLSGIWYDIPE